MELLGDSARGSDWAAVRLRVDGDRIVDADADGLAQDLRGLTLLEAAAVGGETLPVDALANALAPAVRAAADPERVAVAMSGGVDSAVTLLRSGPNAVGVTLRLWLDPHGPDTERACCSPSAVIAARTLCHSRGLPTSRSTCARSSTARSSRRSSAATRAARHRTRASAATAAFASPSCSRSRAASVRRVSRPATTRASSSETGGRCSRARPTRRRIRATCSRGSTRAGSRTSRSRSGRRRRRDARRGGGGRARRSAAAREPGGVLPRRRRLPRVPRASGARVRSPARSSTRHGVEVGEHDGYWRFTPGQRRGLGVAAAEPLYALETNARANTVVVGPRASLARRTRDRARPALRSGRTRRGEAPLPLAGGGGDVEETASGFRLRLDEPAYGVARGQAAVLYDGDVVVGSGLVTSARAD